MPSPGGIRDRIGTPNLPALRRLAVRQINHVQGEAPSDQLLATALSLVAMSESIGLDPHELVATARRVMAHAEGPFTHQIQALRDYARGELTNH